MSDFVNDFVNDFGKDFGNDLVMTLTNYSIQPVLCSTSVLVLFPCTVQSATA